MRILNQSKPVALIALPLFLVLTVASCIPRGGFERGIRIESFEALATTPSAKVPLPGVINTGLFVVEAGPPSSVSGNRKDFQGVTGPNAISDYPDARDNGFWDLTASWATTIPVCPPARGQFLVPPGGREFEAICFL